MLAATRLANLLKPTHSPSAQIGSRAGRTVHALHRATRTHKHAKSRLSSLYKAPSASYHSSMGLMNKDTPNVPTFGSSGEYSRLKGSGAGSIDDQGNFKGPGGLSMPTQSSGGLTKRDNDDISKLDIFEGEGAAITAYSATGFVVHEEYTEGAILAFPKKFWSWNAASVDDITIEKLAPIWLHNPAPQILVIGTGPTLVRPSPELLKFLQVRGIAAEIGNTPNAVATYNFLLQEEREVAGAFLMADPPAAKAKDAGFKELEAAEKAKGQ